MYVAAERFVLTSSFYVTAAEQVREEPELGVGRLAGDRDAVHDGPTPVLSDALRRRSAR